MISCIDARASNFQQHDQNRFQNDYILILVEGIPGAGKTSLIAKIQSIIKSLNKGHEVILITEEGQNKIFTGRKKCIEGVCESDIGLLSRQLILDWTHFINRCKRHRRTLIMDNSLLFQTEILHAGCMDMSDIKDYFTRIACMFKNIRTALILVTCDPNLALDRALNSRDEKWKESVINFISNSTCSKNLFEISDDRKVISFFTECQNIKKALIIDSGMDIFVIDNMHPSSPESMFELTRFLERILLKNSD